MFLSECTRYIPWSDNVGQGDCSCLMLSGSLEVTVYHLRKLNSVKLKHVGSIKVPTPKIRTLGFSLHPLTLCLGHNDPSWSRTRTRTRLKMCQTSIASEERQTLGPGIAHVMTRYGKVNEVLQQDATRTWSRLQQTFRKLIPSEFFEVFAMQG